MAAKQGNTDAQFNLAICYETGEGVPRNYMKAVFYYKEAAKEKDSRAMYNLAHCYYAGKGVERNLHLAALW